MIQLVAHEGEQRGHDHGDPAQSHGGDLVDERLPVAGGLDAELQRAYFDAMHFCRIAEQFGEHSLFDISLLPATGRGKNKRSMLCLRNVVPAPFLAPRLEQARSTVLFSATMPKSVQGLAQDLMNDPVRLEAAPTATTVEKVDQRVIFVFHQWEQHILNPTPV